MGLMNSPAKRVHGCCQWVRSYGVNEVFTAGMNLFINKLSIPIQKGLGMKKSLINQRVQICSALSSSHYLV